MIIFEIIIILKNIYLFYIGKLFCLEVIKYYIFLKDVFRDLDIDVDVF